MDLNHLYYRHGASLMLAQAAASSSARILHETIASEYAARIADNRSIAKPRSKWTTCGAYETIAPERRPSSASMEG